MLSQDVQAGSCCERHRLGRGYTNQTMQHLQNHLPEPQRVVQTLKKWRLRRTPRASTDQSERHLTNRLPQQYAGRRRGRAAARRRRGGRGQGPDRRLVDHAGPPRFGARRGGVGRRVRVLFTALRG